MRLSYSLMIALCFVVFLGGCRKNKNVSGPDLSTIDFRLDTLGHERFYLNQYRGKVVILTFWSTWCTICKTQMVEMKSYSAPEYKNLIIAAVCNDPENIDDVKNIIKTLGIDYPVLLDKNANIFKKLKMSAVPTTVIIDQSGKISSIRQGYDANIKKQIKTSIENLLAAEKNPK